MGRHRRNNDDDNQPKRARDDEAIAAMLDFDTRDAELNAKFKKERETWGPVKNAMHDAMTDELKWYRRGKKK